VEDNDGATDTDEVIITVAPCPSNLPFFDGFEDGTGNWTISGAWTRTNAGHHSGSWAMRMVPSDIYIQHNKLTLNETLNLTGTYVFSGVGDARLNGIESSVWTRPPSHHLRA
jgi:hypothetical protein